MGFVVHLLLGNHPISAQGRGSELSRGFAHVSQLLRLLEQRSRGTAFENEDENKRHRWQFLLIIPYWDLTTINDDLIVSQWVNNVIISPQEWDNLGIILG